MWKYKWFRFPPVSLAFITFKIIYYQLNNEYCNKFPTARFRLVLSFRRSLVCIFFVFSTLYLLPFVVLWILQRKLSVSSLGLFRHLLQSFERECGIVSVKKIEWTKVPDEFNAQNGVYRKGNHFPSHLISFSLFVSKVLHFLIPRTLLSTSEFVCEKQQRLWAIALFCQRTKDFSIPSSHWHWHTTQSSNDYKNVDMLWKKTSP